MYHFTNCITCLPMWQCAWHFKEKKCKKAKLLAMLIKVYFVPEMNQNWFYLMI